MTRRTKKIAAIGGGFALLAGGSYLALAKRASLPLIDTVFAPPPCPLSGLEPRNEGVLDRPAVALKIENNPVAYPLSGLEEAEIVYEEQVEGGMTRFMAIYHCRDATKAGPVRSARIVDPAIVTPFTRILADAGGNPAVRDELDKFGVVHIDETDAGSAMQRLDRPGISFEHTLYGNTKALRRIGDDEFSDAPPAVFEFGDLDGKSRKVKSVTINFSSSVIGYEWKSGRWYRTDGGAPLMTESGDQVAADNVLIEFHVVNLSDTLGDVLGTASPEIEDVTGSGKALLFRDGRVIRGKWVRDSVDEPVRFETKSVDAMILKPGTTWIELVPNDKGEVTGSVSW